MVIAKIILTIISVVYIPYTMGYGNRTSGPIPAFSTLIFEVELLGIAYCLRLSVMQSVIRPVLVTVTIFLFGHNNP